VDLVDEQISVSKYWQDVEKTVDSDSDRSWMDVRIVEVEAAAVVLVVEVVDANEGK
jgi:hypothetical protein